MHFCVTKDFVADFAAGKRVPLFDEPMMAVIFSLRRSLIRSSRLAPTTSKVLERQCRYIAFPASHCMAKIEAFTGTTTVRIQQTAPSQPGSFLAINLWSRLQPAKRSSMQTSPAAAPTSTSFP